jgi:hypothetical protein
MRTFLLTVTTAAAVLTSAPLLTGTATAASRQLAQVDVQIAPPAVRIEEDRRPGVVIEERRRVAPGVVIEGTDGRRRDCVTRSESETRNGVRLRSASGIAVKAGAHLPGVKCPVSGGHFPLRRKVPPETGGSPATLLATSSWCALAGGRPFVR